MKKMKTIVDSYVDIFNESSNFTNEENCWDSSVVDILKNTLDRADSLNYEITNCERGSFSKCKTNEELADFLKSLADEIMIKAEEIKNI